MPHRPTRRTDPINLTLTAMIQLKKIKGLNATPAYLSIGDIPFQPGQICYACHGTEVTQPADRPCVHYDIGILFRGFHHLHEFRHEIEFSQAGGRTTGHITHFVDGAEVERFAWGHGLTGIYQKDSALRLHYAPFYRKRWEWDTGLVSTHAVRRDLPCCGGRYLLEKDHGAEISAHQGRCADCGTPYYFRDHSSFYVIEENHDLA